MANGDASQMPDQGDAGASPLGGAPPSPAPRLQAGAPGGVLAALQRQQQTPQPTTPGAGDQGDSLMMVKQAMEMLQQALNGLGAGTPAYRAAVRSLGLLNQHLPQGAPTAGVQQTFQKDIARRLAKNWLLQQVNANQQAGGGAGGGGGQGGQPMPATPLPGA